MKAENLGASVPAAAAPPPSQPSSAMALRLFALRSASALRLSSRPSPFAAPLLRHFSSKIPEGLKYSKSHEWLKVDGDVGTMGLTAFAVEQLGDVVYVELPEVGAEFGRGDSIGTVESVKASSSFYAPVGGSVVDINSGLKDSPEKVSKDPFGESWLVKLKLSDQKDLDHLLNAAAYNVVVEQEKH